MCKPCVGAKVIIRFQALISHAFLNRSIPFLYHISACTSGSICRKRILFISRFGAIVSHFVRGDIFFDSPCSPCPCRHRQQPFFSAVFWNEAPISLRNIIEYITNTRCMNSTLSCRLTYRITLSERVDTLSTGAKMAESVNTKSLNH